MSTISISKRDTHIAIKTNDRVSVCSGCNYQNLKSSAECRRCKISINTGSQVNTKPDNSKINSKYWSCVDCSYENQTASSVCRRCEKSKTSVSKNAQIITNPAGKTLE